MLLEELPIEVLGEIFRQVCSTSDHKPNCNLLYLSKFLASVAEPHVYYHLDFGWMPADIEALSRISQARRPSPIHSLAFWDKPERPGPVDWAFESGNPDEAIERLQSFMNTVAVSKIDELILGEDIIHRAYIATCASGPSPSKSRLLQAFLCACKEPTLRKLHLINWSEHIHHVKPGNVVTRQPEAGVLSSQKLRESVSKLETIEITLPNFYWYSLEGRHVIRIFHAVKTLRLHQTVEQKAGSPFISHEPIWGPVGAKGSANLQDVSLIKCQLRSEPILGTLVPSLPTLRRLCLRDVILYSDNGRHAWGTIFRALSQTTSLIEVEIRNLRYSAADSVCYQTTSGRGPPTYLWVPTARARPGCRVLGLLTSHNLEDFASLSALLAVVNELRKAKNLPPYEYDPEAGSQAFHGQRDSALSTPSRPFEKQLDLATQLGVHNEALVDVNEIEWGTSPHYEFDYKTLVQLRQLYESQGKPIRGRHTS